MESIVEYDDTEEGKQKKKELESTMEKFRPFIEMGRKISDHSVENHIASIIPDIATWHKKFVKPKKIKYAEALQVLGKYYWPVKAAAATPPIRNFIICCKFRIFSPIFSRIADRYMEARNDMIKSGSVWARGLPEIVSKVVSISRDEFNTHFRMCSDYSESMNPDNYWSMDLYIT